MSSFPPIVKVAAIKRYTRDQLLSIRSFIQRIDLKLVYKLKNHKISFHLPVVVVVVDPTPPTCCQPSPAPESCGSQQSLPPGGKERLYFVGIRPEVQARKGGW